MDERVKVFTYFSGHGATLVDPPLEDMINRWLENCKGDLIQISQSESERSSMGHHVTVCIWYVPAPASGEASNA